MSRQQIDLTNTSDEEDFVEGHDRVRNNRAGEEREEEDEVYVCPGCSGRFVCAISLLNHCTNDCRSRSICSSRQQQSSDQSPLHTSHQPSPVQPPSQQQVVQSTSTPVAAAAAAATQHHMMAQPAQAQQNQSNQEDNDQEEDDYEVEDEDEEEEDGNEEEMDINAFDSNEYSDDSSVFSDASDASSLPEIGVLPTPIIQASTTTLSAVGAGGRTVADWFDQIKRQLQTQTTAATTDDGASASWWCPELERISLVRTQRIRDQSVWKMVQYHGGWQYQRVPGITIYIQPCICIYTIICIIYIR